ncbi:MAG: hypothetical protein KJO54_10980 [Gammaproteobacteria bacterium]|nr:hypothetical protein [Gammaproteobacteria bacterium]NNF59945.1 hypothetical protein [Gammaproteobacteria bacterium]NNM19691.1 hypothetical protein [Gammaproteobacteria bacterium]
MSVFVRLGGRLEHILNLEVALDCPHCNVHSHLSAVSVPRYEYLARFKPDHTGIVFRCDSCNDPVFLRFGVVQYATDHAELDSLYEEVERPNERFELNGNNRAVQSLFNEALTCYASGCLDAFASMCRRTAQAVFDDLGESGKLTAFDEFNDAARLAGLDDDTLSMLRKVVFDSDTDGRSNIPQLEDESAGVLLEMMKDLLYQIYVRRGRLRRALAERTHRLQVDDEDAHRA